MGVLLDGPMDKGVMVVGGGIDQDVAYLDVIKVTPSYDKFSSLE